MRLGPAPSLGSRAGNVLRARRSYRILRPDPREEPATRSMRAILRWAFAPRCRLSPAQACFAPVQAAISDRSCHYSSQAFDRATRQSTEPCTPEASASNDGAVLLG